MNRKTILMSPADSKLYEYFERRFNVISSDGLKNFISYEQHHADMQALNINGTIFVNSACSNLINTLSSLNINFVLCENIGSKYPQNIALNAALVGNKLLCRAKHLHEKVRNHCDIRGVEIIDVKQGYTKCSTLVLNNNTIITDDESIAKVSLINNINVLKIEKGDIHLDGSNIGFIGGATTKIGDTVYFFGDTKTHRNADEINKFIAATSLKIECVTQNKLSDIGGIVLID